MTEELETAAATAVEDSESQSVETILTEIFDLIPANLPTAEDALLVNQLMLLARSNLKEAITRLNITREQILDLRSRVLVSRRHVASFRQLNTIFRNLPAASLSTFV